MNFPKKDLHKVLASELKRLGYKTCGFADISPVVYIDQISLTNQSSIKGVVDYEISWLFDVIARGNDSMVVYDIVEDIRKRLSIEIEGYVIQSFDYEECVSSDEMDEQGDLVRELQRCRILITKIK